MSRSELVQRIDALRSEQMKSAVANPKAASTALWQLKQWEQEKQCGICNVQMESIAITYTNASAIDQGLVRARQETEKLVSTAKITQAEKEQYLDALESSPHTGDPICTIMLYVVAWSKQSTINNDRVSE
jgi:hypothetical protein